MSKAKYAVTAIEVLRCQRCGHDYKYYPDRVRDKATCRHCAGCVQIFEDQSNRLHSVKK